MFYHLGKKSEKPYGGGWQPHPPYFVRPRVKLPVQHLKSL